MQLSAKRSAGSCGAAARYITAIMTWPQSGARLAARDSAHEIPEAALAWPWKMSEQELSESLAQTDRPGKSTYMVCTTIIETGVDVPNVNTPIIDNADRMEFFPTASDPWARGRPAVALTPISPFTRNKVLE